MMLIVKLTMRLFWLLLLLAASTPAFSQVYQHTEGVYTFMAFDFSGPPAIQGITPTPSGSTVLWLTTCSKTVLPSKLRAILDYRDGGKTTTLVLNFPVAANAICSSLLLPDIKRADVINLSLILSTIDLPDIAQ